MDCPDSSLGEEAAVISVSDTGSLQQAQLAPAVPAPA
jgi:hypothetical protein